MYTCIETKCGAEFPPVLTAFRRVIELGILYGLRGKLRLITVEKRAVYSPYNRILLSTSPREFLAAHRYVPTSFFCKLRIVRIIRTSNGDFVTVWTSCLTLDIIIAPGEAYSIIPILLDRKVACCFFSCSGSVFLLIDMRQ